jgi:protein TonB
MKKLLILLMPVLFAGHWLAAQTPAVKLDTLPNGETIFKMVETQPAFKGGQKAWIAFLDKNLQYPPAAIDNEIQGTVMTDFIIDKDGKISDIKIVKSPGKALSEEATRIIQLSDGNWLPGTQNGQKVKCHMHEPIVFKLSK